MASWGENVLKFAVTLEAAKLFSALKKVGSGIEHVDKAGTKWAATLNKDFSKINSEAEAATKAVKGLAPAYQKVETASRKVLALKEKEITAQKRLNETTERLNKNRIPGTKKYEQTLRAVQRAEQALQKAQADRAKHEKQMHANSNRAYEALHKQVKLVSAAAQTGAKEIRELEAHVASFRKEMDMSKRENQKWASGFEAAVRSVQGKLRTVQTAYDSLRVATKKEADAQHELNKIISDGRPERIRQQAIERLKKAQEDRLRVSRRAIDTEKDYRVALEKSMGLMGEYEKKMHLTQYNTQRFGYHMHNAFAKANSGANALINTLGTVLLYVQQASQAFVDWGMQVTKMSGISDMSPEQSSMYLGVGKLLGIDPNVMRTSYRYGLKNTATALSNYEKNQRKIEYSNAKAEEKALLAKFNARQSAEKSKMMLEAKKMQMEKQDLARYWALRKMGMAERIAQEKLGLSLQQSSFAESMASQGGVFTSGSSYMKAQFSRNQRLQRIAESRRQLMERASLATMQRQLGVDASTARLAKQAASSQLSWDQAIRRAEMAAEKDKFKRGMAERLRGLAKEQQKYNYSPDVLALLDLGILSRGMRKEDMPKPQEIIQKLIEMIPTLEPGKRMKVMQKFFGRGAEGMIRFFMTSKSEKDRLAKEVGAAGMMLRKSDLKSWKAYYEQIRIMQLQWQGVQIAIMRSLVPVVSKIIPKLKPILTFFREHTDAIVKVIGALGAYAVAVKGAYGAYAGFNIAKGAYNMFFSGSKIGEATTAMGGFKGIVAKVAPLFFNPTTGIIAGIALAAGGAYLLYKKWKPFHGAVDWTLRKLKLMKAEISDSVKALKFVGVGQGKVEDFMKLPGWKEAERGYELKYGVDLVGPQEYIDLLKQLTGKDKEKFKKLRQEIYAKYAIDVSDPAGFIKKAQGRPLFEQLQDSVNRGKTIKYKLLLDGDKRTFNILNKAFQKEGVITVSVKDTANLKKFMGVLQESNRWAAKQGEEASGMGRIGALLGIQSDWFTPRGARQTLRSELLTTTVRTGGGKGPATSVKAIDKEKLKAAFEWAAKISAGFNTLNDVPDEYKMIINAMLVLMRKNPQLGTQWLMQFIMDNSKDALGRPEVLPGQREMVPLWAQGYTEGGPRPGTKAGDFAPKGVQRTSSTSVMFQTGQGLGSDLTAGIVKGAKDKKVMTSLQGVAKWLAKETDNFLRAKEAFDSHSPSWLGVRLGEDIVKGIAKGMRGGKGMMSGVEALTEAMKKFMKSIPSQWTSNWKKIINTTSKSVQTLNLLAKSFAQTFPRFFAQGFSGVIAYFDAGAKRIVKTVSVMMARITAAFQRFDASMAGGDGANSSGGQLLGVLQRILATSGGGSGKKRRRAYAQGGYVEGPQPALIGERGPEFVFNKEQMYGLRKMFGEVPTGTSQLKNVVKQSLREIMVAGDRPGTGAVPVGTTNGSGTYNPTTGTVTKTSKGKTTTTYLPSAQTPYTAPRPGTVRVSVPRPGVIRTVYGPPSTRQGFAAAVLAKLGIAPNSDNLEAFMRWEAQEGGGWNWAAYNPLNTTQPMPGYKVGGAQGNIGIYTNWNQGVSATAKTLSNGLYGGILNSFRSHDEYAMYRAINSSRWGTRNLGPATGGNDYGRVPYNVNPARLARKFVNKQVPYVWGGTSMKGADCSGMVYYVYKNMGVTLPGRGATDESRGGIPVPFEKMRPGDLIFYGSPGYSHHVAMYSGNGNMIEEYSTGTPAHEVPVDLNGAWTAKRILRPGTLSPYGNVQAGGPIGSYAGYGGMGSLYSGGPSGSGAGAWRGVTAALLGQAVRGGRIIVKSADQHEAIGTALSAAPAWLLGIWSALGLSNLVEAATKREDTGPIAAMAHGGYVESPTRALIGERGPEFVFNRDQMRGLRDMFGTVPRTMHLDIQGAGKELAETFTTIVKQKGFGATAVGYNNQAYTAGRPYVHRIESTPGGSHRDHIHMHWGGNVGGPEIMKAGDIPGTGAIVVGSTNGKVILPKKPKYAATSNAGSSTSGNYYGGGYGSAYTYGPPSAVHYSRPKPRLGRIIAPRAGTQGRGGISWTPAQVAANSVMMRVAAQHPDWAAQNPRMFAAGLQTKLDPYKYEQSLPAWKVGLAMSQQVDEVVRGLGNTAVSGVGLGLGYAFNPNFHRDWTLEGSANSGRFLMGGEQHGLKRVGQYGISLFSDMLGYATASGALGGGMQGVRAGIAAPEDLVFEAVQRGLGKGARSIVERRAAGNTALVRRLLAERGISNVDVVLNRLGGLPGIGRSSRRTSAIMRLAEGHAGATDSEIGIIRNLWGRSNARYMDPFVTRGTGDWIEYNARGNLARGRLGAVRATHHLGPAEDPFRAVALHELGHKFDLMDLLTRYGVDKAAEIYHGYGLDRGSRRIADVLRERRADEWMWRTLGGAPNPFKSSLPAPHVPIWKTPRPRISLAAASKAARSGSGKTVAKYKLKGGTTVFVTEKEIGYTGKRHPMFDEFENMPDYESNPRTIGPLVGARPLNYYEYKARNGAGTADQWYPEYLKYWPEVASKIAGYRSGALKRAGEYRPATLQDVFKWDNFHNVWNTPYFEPDEYDAVRRFWLPPWRYADFDMLQRGRFPQNDLMIGSWGNTFLATDTGQESIENVMSLINQGTPLTPPHIFIDPVGAANGQNGRHRATAMEMMLSAKEKRLHQQYMRGGPAGVPGLIPMDLRVAGMSWSDPGVSEYAGRILGVDPELGVPLKIPNSFRFTPRGSMQEQGLNTIRSYWDRSKTGMGWGSGYPMPGEMTLLSRARGSWGPMDDIRPDLRPGATVRSLLSAGRTSSGPMLSFGGVSGVSGPISGFTNSPGASTIARHIFSDLGGSSIWAASSGGKRRGLFPSWDRFYDVLGAKAYEGGSKRLLSGLERYHEKWGFLSRFTSLGEQRELRPSQHAIDQATERAKMLGLPKLMVPDVLELTPDILQQQAFAPVGGKKALDRVTVRLPYNNQYDLSMAVDLTDIKSGNPLKIHTIYLNKNNVAPNPNKTIVNKKNGIVTHFTAPSPRGTWPLGHRYYPNGPVGGLTAPFTPGHSGGSQLRFPGVDWLSMIAPKRWKRSAQEREAARIAKLAKDRAGAVWNPTPKDPSDIAYGYLEAMKALFGPGEHPFDHAQYSGMQPEGTGFIFSKSYEDYWDEATGENFTDVPHVYLELFGNKYKKVPGGGKAGIGRIARMADIHGVHITGTAQPWGAPKGTAYGNEVERRLEPYQLFDFYRKHGGFNVDAPDPESEIDYAAELWDQMDASEQYDQWDDSFEDFLADHMDYQFPNSAHMARQPGTMANIFAIGQPWYQHPEFSAPLPAESGGASFWKPLKRTPSATVERFMQAVKALTRSGAGTDFPRIFPEGGGVSLHNYSAMGHESYLNFVTNKYVHDVPHAELGLFGSTRPDVRGAGSAAIERLGDLADLHGVHITGEAVPWGKDRGYDQIYPNDVVRKLKPWKLFNFYERHGGFQLDRQFYGFDHLSNPPKTQWDLIEQSLSDYRNGDIPGRSYQEFMDTFYLPLHVGSGADMFREPRAFNPQGPAFGGIGRTIDWALPAASGGRGRGRRFLDDMFGGGGYSVVSPNAAAWAASRPSTLFGPIGFPSNLPRDPEAIGAMIQDVFKSRGKRVKVGAGVDYARGYYMGQPVGAGRLLTSPDEMAALLQAVRYEMSFGGPMDLGVFRAFPKIMNYDSPHGLYTPKRPGMSKRVRDLYRSHGQEIEDWKPLPAAIDINMGGIQRGIDEGHYYTHHLQDYQGLQGVPNPAIARYLRDEVGIDQIPYFNAGTRLTTDAFDYDPMAYPSLVAATGLHELAHARTLSMPRGLLNKVTGTFRNFMFKANGSYRGAGTRDLAFPTLYSTTNEAEWMAESLAWLRTHPQDEEAIDPFLMDIFDKRGLLKPARSGGSIWDRPMFARKAPRNVLTDRNNRNLNEYIGMGRRAIDVLSPEELQTALMWYNREPADIIVSALTKGIDVRHAMNATAVLSQRQLWPTNHRAAKELLEHYAAGRIGAAVPGFPDVQAKAWRAIQGEEIEALYPGGRSLKIPNFSRNLMGDVNAVTIDTWMQRVLRNDPSLKGVPEEAMYLRMADAVQLLSGDYGWTPRETQSAIWAGGQSGRLWTPAASGGRSGALGFLGGAGLAGGLGYAMLSTMGGPLPAAVARAFRNTKERFYNGGLTEDEEARQRYQDRQKSRTASYDALWPWDLTGADSQYMYWPQAASRYPGDEKTFHVPTEINDVFMTPEDVKWEKSGAYRGPFGWNADKFTNRERLRLWAAHYGLQGIPAQFAPAIMSSHTMPSWDFRAYSGGGVVNRPTVALMGEGGRTETVFNQDQMRELGKYITSGGNGQKIEVNMYVSGVVADNETAVHTLSSRIGNQIGREVDIRLNGMS